MSNIQLLENLYVLRKTHRMTQKDLAKLLNISRQAYSNYETGKRTPDLDLIIRVSEIYQISLDLLINQTYSASNILRERKGPYQPAMEIESGNTLYLTKEEVWVIKNYRTLPAEAKSIVDMFLDKQKA